MQIIDKLKLPDDLKKLNEEDEKKLVDDLIEIMIDLSKVKSIHFSSNLSVIHLTIALLKVFNPLKDQIVFDVGHQTYIYKILTDRLNKIYSIRDENGLSGFQNPQESKYDVYSAGHAATSISAAMGIYFGLNKEDKINNDVISVVGDASLASGLSLEALESNSYVKAPIIIVINDNNMSISENVGSLHDILYKLKIDNNDQDNFFQKLNFEYIGAIDGHNINEITNALLKAKIIKKNKHKSVIIHIKTIKGYGFKLDDKGLFHSYKYNNNIEDNIKNSNGYFLAQSLIKRKNSFNDFIVVSPSMTFSMGFSELQKKYPENFVDLGIQEENAVTIASGISIKKNFRPIVATYSTFIQRSYDQLLHDVARLNLGLTLLLDRADLAISDGSSHMGIYDVSMLKSIPNTIITSGLTKIQNKKLLEISLNSNPNQIFTIRYAAKEFCKNQELINLIDKKEIINKQWQIIKHFNKNQICFISYGTYYLEILNNFLNVTNSTSFINAIFIHGYDKNNLNWLFNQNFKTIIIYERINNTNGLATDIESFCVQNKIQNIKIIKLGYSGFIEHGSLSNIDKKFNMDFESLKKILE